MESCPWNLYGYPSDGGFPCRSLVKNPLANVGKLRSTLGQEVPLKEKMATNSSVFA